jgi:hypothetical protein
MQLVVLPHGLSVNVLRNGLARLRVLGQPVSLARRRPEIGQGAEFAFQVLVGVIIVSKLGRLTRNAGKRIAASTGWPKAPIMFAHELRRIALQLHLQGLCIAFERRYSGQYIGVRWEPAAVGQQTPATPGPETI